MLKHRVSNAGMQQSQTATPGPTPAPQGNQLLPPDQTQTGIGYVSTENLTAKNEQSPAHMNNSDAKSGLKRITEKYDSCGSLCGSPRKPPLGSPSSDRSSTSFTFPDLTEKFREGVTEQDLLQVDTFYRSHKSEVYVCGCLANMYLGSVKASFSIDQWVFSCTGIPVLLLNSGEHLRERELTILLAEKGTGFTLWRDVIDNLTGYRAPNANFHTLHLSKDHSKLAGLSFDDAGSAAEFLSHINKLTGDPNDDLLKIGKTKKKKSVKEKKKKMPKKSEISQPCCFVHVTKLDRPASFAEEQEESGPSSVVSQPFNFQHLTGPTGTGSDVQLIQGTLSTSLGSKLTLTSTDSIDSGLSEDRSSSKTEKS